MSGSDRRVPTNQISEDASGKIDMNYRCWRKQDVRREQIKPYVVPYKTRMTAFSFTFAVDPNSGPSCLQGVAGHGRWALNNTNLVDVN